MGQAIGLNIKCIGSTRFACTRRGNFVIGVGPGNGQAAGPGAIVKIRGHQWTQRTGQIAQVDGAIVASDNGVVGVFGSNGD